MVVWHGTCRYLSKRHASVHAILQSVFLRWHSWAKAAAHQRCYQQRAALQAWRELLQLQMQLCLKVCPCQHMRTCTCFTQQQHPAAGMVHDMKTVAVALADSTG